jgi:ankyrin repeat protein
MSSVPAPDIDTSQGVVLNKLKAYLKMQARDFPHKYFSPLQYKAYKECKDANDEKGAKKQLDALVKALAPLEVGQCSGLTALWLYRKSEGQENHYFSRLRVIAGWDEKEESLRAGQDELNPKTKKSLYPSGYLATFFDEILNDMRWAHGVELKMRYSTSQSDLVDLYELVKPAGEASLAQEFRMGFVFKQDELIETLKKVITENSMIRVESSTHAIGVVKSNGIYTAYDPNSKSGEKQFTSVEALEEYLEKCFFKDSNLRYDNMPIALSIFRKEDKKPSVYKQSAEELISSFLERNKDIDRRSWDERTSLLVAIEKRDLGIAKLLIERGCNVNAAQLNGATALILAAQNGHIEVVSALIRAKADVNAALPNGGTVLIYAASNGHTEVVSALVAAGAKMNATLPNGRTALMLAAQQGMLGVVSVLVVAGANVNAALPDGWTILMFAAYKGHTEVVSALVAAGAKMNATLPNGRTALMLAAQQGNLGAVSALLAAKANVNTALSDGRTALTFASGNNEITKLLKEAQQKPHMENKYPLSELSIWNKNTVTTASTETNESVSSKPSDPEKPAPIKPR